MKTPDPETTLYLSIDDMVRLVRRVGLAACIRGVADRIEAEFLRWSEFDKCARIPSYSPGGVIELMPIADSRYFTFKCVNGHPGNTLKGLPTVMAFGLLADVETGMARLMSELTLLTAIRTAAMSALAARRLARPESRVMAVIGNGAQSEFQALAFADQVGIRELRLYDIDPEATAKLVANLAGRGLRVIACASTAEAVRGADIVTTLTAATAQADVLLPGMIEPGMHLNAVGGDCPGKTELHRGVLERATVFCEFEPQTRVEGEIQQMPADFPVVEFWQVLAGEHPGRRDGTEVTLFDSVGFALEDYAALCFVRETALELGMGEAMRLVPRLADPKNLFGVLHSANDSDAPGDPGARKEDAGQPVPLSYACLEIF
jgi:ornithine cyclodeaminase